MARKPKKPVPQPPPPGWPERLRALRERLGLSRAEAAARLRVTQRAWTQWENGRQIPSPPLQLLIELFERGKI